MNEQNFHLGAKAIVCNAAGQVLLMRAIDHKKNPPKEYWDIPGGRVKQGETAEQTLGREVEEETGIKNLSAVTPLATFLTVIRIPAGDGEVGLILSVYLCQTDQEEVVLSHEHTEARWVSPAEAADALSQDLPSLFIEKIRAL